MTKYLLPFLLFVSVGLSQGKGVPKVDPVAKMLADVLQGASRKHVEAVVVDVYGRMDKDLKAALETKLKLGMKRNKLSYERFDAAKLSIISINILTAVSNSGELLRYDYQIAIRRFVGTRDGKHNINDPASWIVLGGAVGNSARLKERIDTDLDKIFLAYLELKE
jgi:hypothetical protein